MDVTSLSTYEEINQEVGRQKMLEISFTCPVCKKKFTRGGDAESTGTCPYCGSKITKESGILNIFKLLCSGGG